MASIKLTISKKYRVWKVDGEHLDFTLIGFGPNGIIVDIDGVHHDNFNLPAWYSIEEIE